MVKPYLSLSIYLSLSLYRLHTLVAVVSLESLVRDTFEAAHPSKPSVPAVVLLC